MSRGLLLRHWPWPDLLLRRPTRRGTTHDCFLAIVRGPVDCIFRSGAPLVVAQPHDGFLASSRGVCHDQIQTVLARYAPVVMTQPHESFVALYAAMAMALTSSAPHFRDTTAQLLRGRLLRRCT